MGSPGQSRSGCSPSASIGAILFVLVGSACGMIAGGMIMGGCAAQPPPWTELSLPDGQTAVSVSVGENGEVVQVDTAEGGTWVRGLPSGGLDTPLWMGGKTWVDAAAVPVDATDDCDYCECREADPTNLSPESTYPAGTVTALVTCDSALSHDQLVDSEFVLMSDGSVWVRSGRIDPTAWLLEGFTVAIGALIGLMFGAVGGLVAFWLFRRWRAT